MKMKNELNALFYKFVKYMTQKWCLVVKDYTKTIDDIYNIKDPYNLFITINWYKKWCKTREEKNINRINFFFLDIDLEDNLDFWKNEIKQKIFEFEKDFVFIIESKNWFHLYIEIEENRYKKTNWELDLNRYKEDWNNKIDYYDHLMWLVFDKNAKKSTQIWRCPWSIHKKEKQAWTFIIELLKWEKKLEKSTIDIINEIPLKQIFDKLGIKYDANDLRIYEENEKTNWWRIKENSNYINNFSPKDRPIWWPFSYVLHHFKKMNWEKNHEKNYIETFNFFKYNFWIIWISQKSKKIKINKLISINLIDSHLSQENIQYLLYISYFATKNNVNDWEESNWISILEFKTFLEDFSKKNIKNQTIISNLEKLHQNGIIKTNSVDKKYFKNFEIIKIVFKKEKQTKFKFCILPNIKEINKESYNSRFFHYFNKQILSIIINNNKLLYFYLYLHEKMILWNKNDLFLKNSVIDEFQINKNPSLRNKKLNDFWKLLWDFEFIKKWDKWFDVRKI